MVLGNHNLEPSRSTLLLFKIFKFHPLQVWTRFVKFGEIHISTPPKIPPKFRQPLVAMRDHFTKTSSRKNPHMPKSFYRTPSMHGYCSYSEKCRFQCCFFVRVSVTSKLCTWHVAHSPSSLSGAPHALLARSWRRWHPGPPAPACSAAAEPP